jgi:hypothetical protein
MHLANTDTCKEIKCCIPLRVLQNFTYSKHTKAKQGRCNVACCADEQQVLFTLERGARPLTTSFAPKNARAMLDATI